MKVPTRLKNVHYLTTEKHTDQLWGNYSCKTALKIKQKWSSKWNGSCSGVNLYGNMKKKVSGKKKNCKFQFIFHPENYPPFLMFLCDHLKTLNVDLGLDLVSKPGITATVRCAVFTLRSADNISFLWESFCFKAWVFKVGNLNVEHCPAVRTILLLLLLFFFTKTSNTTKCPHLSSSWTNSSINHEYWHWHVHSLVVSLYICNNTVKFTWQMYH